MAATVLESLFDVTLLLGLRIRLAAAGAGALLLLFGSAMAISFGIKSPFDYSVFSAMGGSFMLAAWGAYPLSADTALQSICADDRPMRQVWRCGNAAKVRHWEKQYENS